MAEGIQRAQPRSELDDACRLPVQALKGHTMRQFGIDAAKVAMVLVSAGIMLTAFVDVADAKQRYCRKEYCAKRAPGGCSGLFCVPKLGKCVLTGVKVVKC